VQQTYNFFDIMPSLCGEKTIILRKLAENMLPILGVWGKVMSERVDE